MNDPKNPPTTIEEIGIHLFYMGQKIIDLDNTLKDNTKNYASKTELEVLSDDLDATKRRVSKIETKNIVKDTLLWVGLVASAVINIVFVYNLFTGGK